MMAAVKVAAVTMMTCTVNYVYLFLDDDSEDDSDDGSSNSSNSDNDD